MALNKQNPKNKKLRCVLSLSFFVGRDKDVNFFPYVPKRMSAGCFGRGSGADCSVEEVQATSV